MNRTRITAIERAAKATHPVELRGGFSGPRPNRGTLLALPEIMTQVVQAKLIAGDPNNNGGLDANGYQQAFIVIYAYGFTGTTNWPEVRLDVSGLPNDMPHFDDGTYVYAFQFNFTTDGYLLLKPTIFAGPGTVQLIKTGGASYPALGSGANIFPAHIQTGATYSDATNTNTLTSSDGTECRVLNLLSNYIPTGTALLALAIPGTSTSGKAHFLVEYKYGGVVYGHLAGTLTMGGTVNVTVDVVVNATKPTVGDTLVGHDVNSDFAGTSGKHCKMTYDSVAGQWNFDYVAC